MTFWNGRDVLVTGCTGFLGACLTRKLVDRGANVIGLVRDGVWRSSFFMDGTADRVTVVRGDLEDAAIMRRVVSEYEIDTVFHLAAQAIVGAANRDPASTFETNIRGTWVLLEACRASRLVSRIVVASSDKAYGEHDVLPYEEDMPLQGRHPYDVSKSCADLIATCYHATYDTPVCITRCGNLFGPGDPNLSRIIPSAALAALRGQRPVIRSDGSPVRDYVYVEDIADAYLLLAERMEDRSLHGKAFNFGTGEPVSVLELTRRILVAAERTDLEPDVQGVSSGEIQRQYLSSNLARSLLGWRPASDLDARLKDTVAWYRMHLDRF